MENIIQRNNKPIDMRGFIFNLFLAITLLPEINA